MDAFERDNWHMLVTCEVIRIERVYGIDTLGGELRNSERERGNEKRTQK